MTVRRARGQSLTILGDLAQRTAEAGVSSWERRAARGGRRGLRRQRAEHQLPRARRLPAAGRHAAAAGAPAPRGVRDAPFPPVAVATDDVGARPPAWPRGWPGGRQRRRRHAARVPRGGPRRARRTSWTPTRRRGAGPGVNLLDLHVAKGLEFDAIVVVEPAAILAERPDGGVGGLYTALTRSTRALAIVHAEPLPEALAERRNIADRS